MSFGLYIHFPFCKKKCPYCNFSSITADEGLIKRYIEALIIESDHRLTQQYLGYPQTIYIGGGTPSIVPAHYIKKTVKRFLPDNPIEFTVEANPESITTSWLDDMLESGASRISIGFQSLDDRILHNLGRVHTAKQAISSFDLARSAGFSNISIDLMFGV
ncbi:MAG TPA: radical SAM protein, partial [bacterium]|nr:radical SAM protein [bacterium]